MSDLYDVIIVGCGLSGAVVARQLADQGIYVLILEKRNHIGGNLYDYRDEHGILVHKYGPHTFHTQNKELYRYINRFASWIPYKLECGAEINGICVPTPFNYVTVDSFFEKEKAEEIKEKAKLVFGERKTASVVEVLQCGNPILEEYARFLFDNDYSLYTAKQWGVSADEIDPSVLSRVPLRFNYENGYFEDCYQVMPEISYTCFFEKLLDSDNIKVLLDIDAHDLISIEHYDDGDWVAVKGQRKGVPVVYTGAIDELFDFCYGELPYRSLRFEWEHKTVDSFQDMAVVAYPQVEGFTRIVEYKKLPYQDVKGTTIEIEYSIPYTKGKKMEPYYPVLTEDSQKQYARYYERTYSIENLFVCGRLGDFKYYNMDQALEKALKVAANLISLLRNG